jgi:hypothetical protein
MTQLEKWFEDMKNISPNQKDEYMQNVVCPQIRQQTQEEAKAQLRELANSLKNMKDEVTNRKIAVQ